MNEPPASRLPEALHCTPGAGRTPRAGGGPPWLVSACSSRGGRESTESLTGLGDLVEKMEPIRVFLRSFNF